VKIVHVVTYEWALRLVVFPPQAPFVSDPECRRRQIVERSTTWRRAAERFDLPSCVHDPLDDGPGVGEARPLPRRLAADVGDERLGDESSSR